MKVQEFKEQFKEAEWITGHLCRTGETYHRLLKGELLELRFAELREGDKEAVFRHEETQREIEFAHNVLWPARDKLEEYVKSNGKFLRQSNKSSSEYWYCGGYKFRISSHRYPTGSMTDLTLNVIDTTDEDCRPYLKLLGI